MAKDKKYLEGGEGTSRRDFLKAIGAIGVGAACSAFLPGCSNNEQLSQLISKNTGSSNLREGIIAVKGKDHPLAIEKGLEAIGGLSTLVKEGSIVVVKPNIGWDRTPEQGVNTNPTVVAEIVKQCYQCGAGEVRVFDNSNANVKASYRLSGIIKAAEAEGAKILTVSGGHFKKVSVPDGQVVTEFLYCKYMEDADVVINVPTLKHHCITTLSLGLKNLMGLVGGTRSKWHAQIGYRLVDLWTVVRPQLTILDATRMLTAHGPWGGNLKDVKWTNTIAFSTDPIAIDAYGARLFGINPMLVKGIPEGADRGLGQADLSKVNIEEIAV
jgi:uncharacterized protein (DUF362 family)